MYLAIVILNSLLNGIYFALDAASGYRAPVAVMFAAASVALAWSYLKMRKVCMLLVVSILLVAQLTLFLWNLAAATPPFAFRLLAVAILTSNFSVAVTVILLLFRRIPPVEALLAACSAGMGLFIVEAIQEHPRFLPRPVAAHSEVKWAVKYESHPVLGERYAPNTEIKTYYPDNPRGYFKAEDRERSLWWLSVHSDATAEVTFSEEAAGALRINPGKVSSNVPWHIQLNHAGGPLVYGRSYRLIFKARADGGRRIRAAVSQNHKPWSNLGLYQDIEVHSQWHNFGLDFTALATESDSRVHFDVGGNNTAVELADVQLMSQPEEKPIEPVVARRYFVSYRMNSLGCRGPDYAIPKPKGKTRVLILGDSYAMGIGVHEEDTFARKLELTLNERGDRSLRRTGYEVINCGQSGYSTRDERLFYDALAWQYTPDVVILVMYSNDHLSWKDEQKMPHVRRQPSRLEGLFFTWGSMQDYLNRPPFPDYGACVEELLRLNGAVTARRSRLAVVFFRDIPMALDTSIDGRYWNALATMVRRGLQGMNIPILDLRNALFASYSQEDLFVHALDGHPNEIGHAIAAREIQKLLDENALLDHRETREPDVVRDGKSAVLKDSNAMHLESSERRRSYWKSAPAKLPLA
jgi:hypothetical protein